MPQAKIFQEEYSVHFSAMLEYIKRLLLRCIHHFKSDLISNMDHLLCAFRDLDDTPQDSSSTRRVQEIMAWTRREQMDSDSYIPPKLHSFAKGEEVQ